MLNVNIHINRLGPITGPATIQLKPFLIFSGPSGVGKSYLSLLVHYVYRIFSGEGLKEITKEQNIDYERLKEELPDGTNLLYRLSTADLTRWINENAVTYLRNMLGNPELEADFAIDFPGLPENLSFTLKRSTMSLGDGEVIEQVETLNLMEMDNPINLPPYGASWKDVPFRFLISFFLREKYNVDITQSFLMPPSRGSLLTLPESVRSMITGMYKEFIEDLSILKNISPAAYRPRKSNKRIEQKVQSSLKESILHGDIAIVDDEIVYNLSDETAIPITAAASSIKELTPFAIMLQKGYLGQCATLFEEPEAHLHPELQIKVAELLCFSINAGAHMQITTHSDYLLRHINDMVRLGIMRATLNDEDKFSEYCLKMGFDPEAAIPADCINAYYIKPTADNNSAIKLQDSRMGIPFDSFKAVIDNNMHRSAKLYDDVEDLIDSQPEEHTDGQVNQ